MYTLFYTDKLFIFLFTFYESDMKILLIVTMKIEALPIINKLKMQVSDTQLSPFLKTTVYEKKFDDNHLFLVHAGKDPQHNVDALGSGISLVA